MYLLFFVPCCFVVLSISCLVELAGIFNLFIVKNSISKVSLTFLGDDLDGKLQELTKTMKYAPSWGSKLDEAVCKFREILSSIAPELVSFYKHNSISSCFFKPFPRWEVHLLIKMGVFFKMLQMDVTMTSCGFCWNMGRNWEWTIQWPDEVK